MAAAFVALIGMATLAFLTWRAWPVVVEQWKAAQLPAASKNKTSAKRDSPAPPEAPPERSSSSDSVSRLKKENETLRDENSRLREQLTRNEATLKQKASELDEMRLRLLILDKTRSGQP